MRLVGWSCITRWCLLCHFYGLLSKELLWFSWLSTSGLVRTQMLVLAFMDSWKLRYIHSLYMKLFLYQVLTVDATYIYISSGLLPSMGFAWNRYNHWKSLETRARRDCCGTYLLFLDSSPSSSGWQKLLQDSSFSVSSVYIYCPLIKIPVFLPLYMCIYIYSVSFCVPWTTCFISQKLVAFWGEGFQQNNPYRADPNDGFAFRGRGFRLNENNARSSWWTRNNNSSSSEETNATPDSYSDSGVAFRGRGRRLGTR